MHFQSLLEPQLDPTDVAPVLQWIFFECEKLASLAVPWQPPRLYRRSPWACLWTEIEERRRVDYVKRMQVLLVAQPDRLPLMKLETWAILLVLVPAARSAQTGVTGTWKADPSVPLTIVLKADGPKLTGAVDRCSNVQQVPSEIEDGRVEGDRVTFKCISPDGDRIVSFTGRITGDSAEFTYLLNVRDGGRPPELFDPFMSIPGRRVQNAPRFTAARVADTVGEGILARLAARLRAVVDSGPVTFDRLLNAEEEPQNWLTYSGNVYGYRHSALTELTPTNVKDLELAWIWQQPRSAGKFEATPLVVDAVLYTVQSPNDVVALDATTGRFLWTYRYVPAPEGRVSGGGGRVNRGLAILGDTLFMGTIDAHLIAINAKTGAPVWNTTVADAADPMCQIPDRWTYCYSIGGGRTRPTGQVDVAVIQSLVKKGVVDDRVGEYGHLIVDECHHLSAQSFERVAQQAKARFVTGSRQPSRARTVTANRQFPARPNQ